MDYLKLHGCNDNEIYSLFETVKVVSKDIGMRFGIGKCAVLAMTRGKEVKCKEIDLGEKIIIQSAGDERYR